MQAGRLRSRLSFKRPVVTQNGYGEDVAGTPTSLGTFYADVRAVSGRELAQMGQRWAEAEFRIEMRFQPGITFQRKDYAEWGSRRLNILHVEDFDQRRETIRLLAREIVQ